jgi:hypothetical protein
MIVRLVRVNNADVAARFKIGKKGYRVEPTDTFAGEWTLVNLRDGKCATIRHGSTYADLCEGQTYEQHRG